MTIFTIILNYKTKDETLACVESVKKTTLPSNAALKIIVVDNASNDGIERALSQDHPDTIFLQTGANLGYTGGNNVGIRWVLAHTSDYDAKQSSDSYLFILNNDTTLDPHCLDELLRATRRHPDAGIVSPKIYFDPQSLPQKILDSSGRPLDEQLMANLKSDSSKQKSVLWYAGGDFDLANMLGNHRGVDQIDQAQFNEEVHTGFASGCAMFIPLPVMRQVKEFDNNFFMYFEDVDLSLRIKSAGFQLWYAPKAILWHKNASSSSVGSPLQDYFTTRNRLYLALKHHRFRALFALIREALRNRHLSNRFLGFQDFLLLKWGKGSIIKS